MESVSGLVPMVKVLAVRYKSVEYPMGDTEDVFQDGVVGLLEAAARYDPGRGCSLWTFAGKRASGAMAESMRSIGRWSRDSAAGRVDCNDEDVSWNGNPSRSVESYVHLNRFRRFMRDEWRVLPVQWRELIRLRYFEDMSLRDVAAVLGMSAATARRRELEALEELKRRFLAAAA